MRVPKLWRLLPRDGMAADRLSVELRISPVLAQLLINRGIRAVEQARQFLASPLSSLHDPSLLPGAEDAAARIYQAARAGRRIAIYGDYDVDGITGTTILWRCLQLAGAQQVDFYVPHRMDEGYGLNDTALHTLKQQGVEVVVTVDCGITSVREAATAHAIGLELIVTDHHEFRCEGQTMVLPDAAAVVHPRLPGGNYPFPDLCGAGVAFKLAWAICRQFSQARRVTEAFQKFLLESMSLVALGTVADVVPLADENRVFVRHGLRSLRSAPSIGLRALLDTAKLLDGKALNAGHVGFQLAPRLNAAGRLGQARLAVELLATASEQRAVDLARYLEGQNDLRQQIERRIVNEAKEMVEAEYNLDKATALVLASADWHPGVIGIVAGRLVDRYARPVLMVSLKDDPGQGSGRSVPGFHLQAALCACADHLLSHGGHAAAAGFKVTAAALAPFRERFQEEAAKRMNGQARQHVLTIDAEVPLSAMTVNLVKGIAALEPHGMANSRPLFLTGGLTIVGEPRKVGGGERHVSFRVRQENGPTLKAIGFSMAERLDELLSGGGQCCLVFQPKLNEWNGMVNVDLEVVDFQPGPTAALAG